MKRFNPVWVGLAVVLVSIGAWLNSMWGILYALPLYVGFGVAMAQAFRSRA
jgi:hypothetical protein